MRNGLDVIFTEPGTVASQVCPVCGQQMEVRRGVITATSWASAMAGIRSEKDVFTCPAANLEWHIQGAALLELATETESPTLAGIYRKDLLALQKAHIE